MIPFIYILTTEEETSNCEGTNVNEILKAGFKNGIKTVITAFENSDHCFWLYIETAYQDFSHFCFNH